jgi:tetratricopeptide (TPR) repeat protein
MSTKKTPAVERRAATNPALEAFEKAVKTLGKKDFERARELFGDILESYPEERDLLERARAYRAVCDRALSESRRGPFKPKTFEDLLQYGVFLHNRGEFEDALKYLRQAVEMHPKNEHAQYCLAATAARAGDTPSALKALRSAIAAGPSNRAQARSDPDFDPIRDDEGFVEIVYSQAS